MLDARLRKLIDPPLDGAGRRLAQLGVTANSVTWTGFLVGCGAWALLALGSYGWALALILLNRLADGLDGAVARHGRVSDLGG
jgi:phosphatidylglycerophosphate synthase